MQSTTANRPVVINSELERMIRISPLAVILLTALFIALAVASDNIHQMIDPAYRQEIQEEQKSMKALDELLKQTEHKAESSK